MGKNEASEKSPEENLGDYFIAHHPILYINDFDFAAVDRLIEKAIKYVEGAAPGGPFIIREFVPGSGVVSFATKSPIDMDKRKSLVDFLNGYNVRLGAPKNSERFVLVLKEVHYHPGSQSGPEGTLADRRVCGILQSIAQRLMKADTKEDDVNYDVTVVIVDSELAIPPELEKWVTVFKMPLPDDCKIANIIDRFEEINNIKVEESYREKLKQDLKGLSEVEILQLLNLANAIDDGIHAKSRNIIINGRCSAIKKSGLLEAITVEEDEVAGLQALREYFEGVSDTFKHPSLAKKHGVSLPAGVMIVGMPGCGKSLSAKFVAREFGVPLLRLDVGRLMGKYVGESENNFLKAIRMAESAAPCILWIDEIEKAFAGIGSSGGGGEVTTRMFGTFLTWMQEKRSFVYVVATANDISNLPPEFLRRGRFDEIFQVNFPSTEERAEIFKVSLKKHLREQNGGKIPDGIDPAALAEMLQNKDKYSGADIESIVREAMKRLFSRNLKKYGVDNESSWESLTQGDLVDIIKTTKSSYNSQKEKLKPMMEKLDKLNVRSAS